LNDVKVTESKSSTLQEITQATLGFATPYDASSPEYESRMKSLVKEELQKNEGDLPAGLQRRRGGAQGGVHPPPPRRFLRSCWVGEGLSAYQEGQMGQNFVRFAAGDTARSRQDEPIERRPEEQGTQDAEKTNEGMRTSDAMAIEPPPYEGMRLNSSQGLWAGRSPAQVPCSGAGGGTPPRPSDFCAVAGWERASGSTRRAKWAKKWFALGHSQGHEISSRRVERGA
jgi:hypothetical protein